MLFGWLGKKKEEIEEELKLAEAVDKLVEQSAKAKERENKELADNGIKRIVTEAIQVPGNYTIITPDIKQTSQIVQSVLDEKHIEYTVLDKGRFIKCTFRNIFFELILGKNV